MKLAIKGHLTRGKEIIKILEMLGGINLTKLEGTYTNTYYTIDNDWTISGTINTYLGNNHVHYTIEEFLEKFPYKVGDKVQHKGATSCGSVFEVEKMRWEEDTVKYTLHLFGCNYKTSTLPPEYLQPYKEETMEEKIQAYEITGEFCANEVAIEFDPSKFEMIERNGKYFVVKKQPQYPKTYKECCKVLGYEPDEDEINCYQGQLIELFVKLLICRDAYSKIAGEQMGLGKPWKPNWLNTEQDKFVLYTHNNVICLNRFVLGHNVLAFPTAEMRDAFLKNFEDLIEECKELL